MKKKWLNYTMKQKIIIILGIIVVITTILWLLLDTLTDNNVNPSESNTDSSINENGLSDIKKGTLNTCPNFTIEELVNNYMTNIKWTEEKSDKGYYVYNVSGNIYYNDEEVNALIQFAIDDENIIIRDFEIDKIPQSNSVYSKLIEEMCNEITLIEVPDVSGKTVVEAESILKKIGFEVEYVTIKEQSEKIGKGKVIRTVPEANKTINKGSKITIYESLGNVKYEIEDYTGKNYIEVKALLEQQYNLNVSVEKKNVDSTSAYDAEEIISQSVPKGTFLKSGDTIILYIPNIVDKYPDMVGQEWTVEDAEAFCSKHNITLQIEYIQDDSKNTGTIIYQSYNSGDIIVSGSILKVKVIN